MAMYLRFGAMIATSTLVMFGLMYLNTYEFAHVRYSETRTYMALVMGAAMAIIMLSFMTHMLKNWRINLGILLGSILVFALALWMVRSQRTVEDLSYMRAMIPHHSIAILTSERAQISDTRVRRLADDSVKAQLREIAEMEVLISDIESHGKQTSGGKTATALRLGPEVPPPDASAVMVLDGFRAEVVLSGLTYPTSVEFDDQGSMYVAESGYAYGGESPEPRVLRISPQGHLEELAHGKPLAGPINDLLWHENQLYISHRGKISILEKDGQLHDLVAGLPSDGDHHNNQMTVGPAGKIYFGQGTATNSGVVGIDNYKTGWLTDHPDFHDIPAKNVTLAGRTFETANVLKEGEQIVETSSFHEFGKAAVSGGIVNGKSKASGTILRMDPDGSKLDVYAWGLRNPFGVMWSPDDKLYASENGFDVRGSRPIANDQEDIYIIKENAWYGWPDYAMGLPVTDQRFHAFGKPEPSFLMTQHPPVEKPWLNFPKHSAITKLEFSRTVAFGEGQLFAAFFGHMSPMTGEPPSEHGGHRVVRIDPTTRKAETFFGQRKGHGAHHENGGGARTPADNTGEGNSNAGEKHSESLTAGPRRLMDVRFPPDGKALYIADFGSMVVKDKPIPVPGTGVIWRVVPEDSEPQLPPANLSILK